MVFEECNYYSIFEVQFLLSEEARLEFSPLSFREFVLVSPLCVHVNLLPHFPEIPSASGRIGALPGTTAMQGIILGVRVNMTISAVEHCRVEHVARNWAALFIYYHMRVISK